MLFVMWNQKTLLSFFVLLHLDQATALKDVHSWRNVTYSPLPPSSTIYRSNAQASTYIYHKSSDPSQISNKSPTSTFSAIVKKQESPTNESNSTGPAGWYSPTATNNITITANLNESIPLTTSSVSLSSNTTATALTALPTTSTSETMSRNISTQSLPFFTSNSIASPTTALLVLSSAVMAASQTVSDTSLSATTSPASSLDTAVSDPMSLISTTDPALAASTSATSDTSTVSSVSTSTDIAATSSLFTTTGSTTQTPTETSSTSIPITTDSTTSSIPTTASETLTSTSSSVSLGGTSTLSSTSSTSTSASSSSTTGLLTATSSTPIFTSSSTSISSTSDATPTSAPSTKHNLSTQEIAGISFGALAGIMLLGLFLLALYRRRRARKTEAHVKSCPESAWLYDPRMSPVPPGAVLLNRESDSSSETGLGGIISQNNRNTGIASAGMTRVASGPARPFPGALTSNPPPRFPTPVPEVSVTPHTPTEAFPASPSSQRTNRHSGIPAALQPGRGSVFGFTLPRARTSAHTGAQRESRALGRRATLQKRVWEVKRSSGGRPWSFTRGDDSIGLAK